MVELSESSFIVATPSMGLSFSCYPVMQHSHPGHALFTTSGDGDIPTSRLSRTATVALPVTGHGGIIGVGTAIFYGVFQLYQPSQLRPYPRATL